MQNAVPSRPPAVPDHMTRRENAARDLQVLADIVHMLPAAVTVRDAQGSLLLVNDAAATLAKTTACGLGHASGSMPVAAGAGADAAMTAIRSGRPVTLEERVAGSDQVLLTTHRPMVIADHKWLLSTSVDISAQKAAEDELYRRAFYDELTGLPTRRVIEAQAESLIRRPDDAALFALAFFDIDNFKQINDYYGHTTGDALLVAVAKRLSLALRESDMLARISGDEFLLLLSPVESAAEVADYIERLLQKVRAPFFIDGSEVFASVSIGISLSPDHGRNYDQLRQNADIAMYRVKSTTKGAAAFFDDGMESEALARMALEQSLRLAILEKRFFCAFQPKVDIRTHEVMGIEALVRLRNDNGEIQAPGDFINLATELGLIDELTHLVLAEIMRSIDLIDDAFGPQVSISINVAAKQANNADFMRSFARALHDTGCPKRFIIEVTEDAFVHKSHFQKEILPILRDLGVGISIDDFGVGYSSLSALADITADEIKIDRSFITDIHKRPRSQGILKAIESLSEALGMTVVAEGLETFEELAYLQAATRIRYAQGFYFAKPVLLDELKPTESAGQFRGMSRQQDVRPAYSRARGFGR